MEIAPDVEANPVILEESNGVDSEKRKMLLNIAFRSAKRSQEIFASDYDKLNFGTEDIDPIYKKFKLNQVSKSVRDNAENLKKQEIDRVINVPKHKNVGQMIGSIQSKLAIGSGNKQLAIDGGSKENMSSTVGKTSYSSSDNTVRSLLPSRTPLIYKPTWHAPWKLYRVIPGHTGWVRAVDVDPKNEFFVTGSADRMVKIWDLATGKLKLSLTGHISSVRGVKVSDRHPLLFSCGEDKQVKCWDLESNKVTRHFHGHLSAVQGLTLHPTLDLLVTAGRDSTVRVWDIRTKTQVFTLTGHTNTVASVITQAMDPQIISSSHDSTVRLWDLAAGKSMGTLTHHKKSVRALCLHPTLAMFASGSTNDIRQWKSRNADFIRSLTQHQSVINSLACNDDGVLVSGGDNGTMHFWDWNSGFCFQQEMIKTQAGSIDSESGVYCMTFDKSGTRLITGDADKSVKMYKEDLTATEESHPILWRPNVLKKQKL
uniref:WD_REPEATS_REGION domain-containing protein n=1 Tax=Rhabditophanes sp. KR3021 TaxID=114890 RepID=A0AC35TSK3_9BILA